MFMFWACASAWGMAHKSQNQGQKRLWSTWDLPPHFSYQLFHYKLWLIMSPNLRPPFLRFNNIPKALDLRTACLNNNNAYLYISLFAKHFLRHYFIWSSWKPWKDRQLFSHSFTDEETDLRLSTHWSSYIGNEGPKARMSWQLAHCSFCPSCSSEVLSYRS